jgi:hypothetical protein
VIESPWSFWASASAKRGGASRYSELVEIAVVSASAKRGGANPFLVNQVMVVASVSA